MPEAPRPSLTRILLRHISPAASGTLYDQLIQAIKAEIASGALAPGDPLPSFRALARDLLVSVITVKRAYEELEREGIVYLRQGLGTFVALDAPQLLRDSRTAEARQLLAEAIQAARQAGLSPNQIRRLLGEILNAPESPDAQPGDAA